MTVLAWIAAGAVTLPIAVLCAECAAGIARPDAVPDPEAVPPFTVLVPAHDEAAGIAATILAIRSQLRGDDRLLVVADNCSDATADIAAAAGAAICSRRDRSAIGKAHALAFGRERLRRAPTPVVIVLDADCVPQPGALLRLAASAHRDQAAVQGEYLLTVAADAGAMVRVSTFAFLVKNRLRQRGLRRLGGPALLQGTGMALPWAVFDAAPLVTASLVEDLKLGLDLLLGGQAVRFDAAAGFRSPASSKAGTTSQRTRWEQGMLATAAAYLPKLLFAGLTRRPALLLVAADLLVPPLAMLALIAGIVIAGLALAGAGVMPLALTAGSLALLAALLALFWLREGREVLPASALPTIARYVIWKLPIYRGLLTGRQRAWVRTSRLP